MDLYQVIQLGNWDKVLDVAIKKGMSIGVLHMLVVSNLGIVD